MFDQYIQQYRDEMLGTLQDLLRIPSVKSEALPDKPFGTGPADALKYVLDLAKSKGLLVRNVDGYAGHTEYGEGNDYIAVVGHLDVVPAGAGWKHPPFGGEIQGDKVYARGVLDDKGPILAALWSLIMLHDLGMRPTRKVRVIFGLDEENDWRCMEHYFAREPAPLGGFTPDADFPMIYAEKGIATLKIEVPAESESMVPKVVRFQAGQRYNMVPDYAFAEIDCHSETAAREWETKLHKEARSRKIELGAEVHDSVIQLTVRGVSAHGSTPQQGVNAITQLAELLGIQSVSNASMWRVIASQDTAGNALGIAAHDDVTGALTVNLGVASLDKQVYSFFFNIRYPVNDSIGSIEERCRSVLSDKWRLVVVENRDPLFVPLDSPVISTLRQVYEEQTQLDSTPIAIGGGTYARAIPNAVAFGALFPGREDVAHQRDEFWYIDDFLRCVSIYAHAIYELANTL